MACFYTFYHLIKRPESHANLAAIGVILLGAASTIGTLKFAFGFEGTWHTVHNLTSRLFGVAGLYLLLAAWLDFGGIVKVTKRWIWVHVADGALLFSMAYWLNQLSNFQLAIGVLMNVVALAVSVKLFRRQRANEALVMSIAAVLFITNGLVIGGAEVPLIGPVMRIDVFHIFFAAWALMLHWLLARNALPARYTLLE
jgi:hypothetical protein